MASIGSILSDRAQSATSSAEPAASSSSAASALSTRASSTASSSVPSLSVTQLVAYGMNKTDLQSDKIWSSQSKEVREAAWQQLQALASAKSASTVIADKVSSVKSSGVSAIVPDEKYGQKTNQEWAQPIKAERSSRYPDYFGNSKTSETISRVAEIVGNSGQRFFYEVARSFGVAMQIVSGIDGSKNYEQITGAQAPEKSKLEMEIRFEMESLGKQIEDRFSKISKENLDQLDIQSTWERYVVAVTDGASSVLSAIGMYAISGGTTLPATFLSFVESSEEYSKAIAAGKTKDEATGIVLADTAVLSILEKYGLDFLFEGQIGLSWVKNKAARWFISANIKATAESTEEVTQDWARNMIAKLTFDGARDVFQDAAFTFAATYPVAFIIGGVAYNSNSTESMTNERNSAKAAAKKELRSKAGLSSKEAAVAVEYMEQRLTQDVMELEQNLTRTTSISTENKTFVDSQVSSLQIQRGEVPDIVNRVISQLSTQGQAIGDVSPEASLNENEPSQQVQQVGDISPEERAGLSENPQINISPDKIDQLKSMKADGRLAEFEAMRNERNIASASTRPSIEELKASGEFNTRKIKGTKEYIDFAGYAESSLQDRDIRAPLLINRHFSLTAERVAEFLDKEVMGRTYKEIVLPVYKSAVSQKIELNEIKKNIEKFKIYEGTNEAMRASLYAQGKLTEGVSENERALARYVRRTYDSLLERMNIEREKLGVEPIKKRTDYITHLNEIRILTELLGGVDRITVKNRIRQRKEEIMSDNPEITPTKAFERAKREVEGVQGIEMYISARQPGFKYAKERMTELEKSPDIIRSIAAYSEPATRYIHQAENVQKNKAYISVLPANARSFLDKWNTEQVAGRVNSIINSKSNKVLTMLRNTFGANSILGNASVTLMQLTSIPPVLSMAGVYNTTVGYAKRISSYVNSESGMFKQSRTYATRQISTDIGSGNTVIDELLIQAEKFKALKQPAAKTRAAMNFGKSILMGLMEQADSFTVGATFEAFYYKNIQEGMSHEEAMEKADIMTGKTQANYFKEALPPFLNTPGGKIIAQFGTYSMNQFEMFKRDFGKDFKGGTSEKSASTLMKHFLVFLFAAYWDDALSETIFGRQPYKVKSFIDKLSTGDWNEIVSAVREDPTSYLPFISSVQFGSLPPVIDFGLDVIHLFTGTEEQASDAKNAFLTKWIFNTMLPYGGSQVKKTLEGIEATQGIDFPLIKDPTKTSSGGDRFVVESVDTLKAILFGPWSTDAALDYLEGSGTSTTKSKNPFSKRYSSNPFSSYSRSKSNPFHR